MRELLQLYLSFFKIGALTFGGGYAMLPMLEREIVQKQHWATNEELLDYFAIGQCTPGVIAVNTATFIGYRRRGVIGGILATCGVVSPSLIIITAIAALLQNFMEIEWIQHMFAGIRVAVAALILTTVIKLVKENVKDWKAISLCVLGFAGVAVFGVSPIWIVLIVVALGVLLTIDYSKKAASGQEQSPSEQTDEDRSDAESDPSSEDDTPALKNDSPDDREESSK